MKIISKKFLSIFLAAILLLALAACSESPQQRSEQPSQKPVDTPIDYESEAMLNQPRHDILTFRADAYVKALCSIYELDPGLNGEIDFIAVDPVGMKDATTDELYQIRSLLSHETGMKVKLMTMEQLKEQGHFDEESYSLKDCVLLSFDEVQYTPEKLILKGQKYRSGLGAIFTDTVVIRQESGWKIEKSVITAIS